MSEQPEALRLAHLLTVLSDSVFAAEAAAELRRQHKVIAELLEACLNFKGLYDTPAERRRRANDLFYAEAIEHLRAAIAKAEEVKP